MDVDDIFEFFSKVIKTVFFALKIIGSLLIRALIIILCTNSVFHLGVSLNFINVLLIGIAVGAL